MAMQFVFKVKTLSDQQEELTANAMSLSSITATVRSRGVACTIINQVKLITNSDKHFQIPSHLWYINFHQEKSHLN